jgi:serine/threonine protein kinase
VNRTKFGETNYAAVKFISIPQNESEIKYAYSEGMDEQSVKIYFKNFALALLEEIRLMSSLKGNTNIVSLEDYKIVEKEDGIGWDILIRMELLKSFVDYLAENKISKREIIKLGIDMCKALEFCQKANIIHRDIKPDNIFVSQHGDYKLGDFGIARQIEKTMSGLSKKGTFSYMAPEVYKGEPYNSTVDIYSLGLVSFRLLNNNRAPFLPDYPAQITHTSREEALIRRIIGEAIPNPINADARLAEIVLKACSY